MENLPSIRVEPHHEPDSEAESKEDDATNDSGVLTGIHSVPLESRWSCRNSTHQRSTTGDRLSTVAIPQSWPVFLTINDHPLPLTVKGQLDLAARDPEHSFNSHCPKETGDTSLRAAYISVSYREATRSDLRHTKDTLQFRKGPSVASFELFSRPTTFSFEKRSVTCQLLTEALMANI